jgi:glycosyltransferase involved in cell wall biosynthesis
MARVCCNSKRTQEKLREYFGIDARVIRMGCDLDKARCEAYEPYFIYPTRLQRYKRVDLAIEAFKRLPGVPLKIIGRGYDGPRLKALAAGHDNICFLDCVDDVYDEYARCLGVVYTPYDEDFGLVPVEAMSCGKPVIAVNEGGPRETVVDGQTGFLVEATPDAIAEKVALLFHDVELARELGRQARERAREFSWSEFAVQFGEVLAEAAG